MQKILKIEDTYTFYAAVTELADVQDLGSCAAMREGSNPSGRSCLIIIFKYCRKILCVPEGGKQEMQVIIVGCGKVGNSLAAQLCMEGCEVTILDKNPARLKTLSDGYDVLALEGDGTSYSVLTSAGIDSADLLVAVTESDEKNLLCCLIGRRAGSVKTIARVRNPIYSNEVQFFMKEFGLAMIINPEMAAAAEIARVFRFPSAISIDSFAKGHVELMSFHLDKKSILCGRKISDIHSRMDCDILVCVVKRGDETIIPSGDFIVEGGDILSIVSSAEAANDFFRKIGIATNRVKNVMIVGGGKITYYLAKILIQNGISVKIIEQNHERCEQLSEELPEAEIIFGDGTDEEILLEEGIEEVEGFASLTGMDEQNIMLSLFAESKTRVQAKLVTKITRITFNDVINNLNLGSIINPKVITTDYILQLARSLQASMGSNVENLYKIQGSDVEVMEFLIRSGSKVVGIPLQTLKIKPNILICKIYRSGRLITPSGSDWIEAGDSVVLTALSREKLKNIEDILES